MFTRKSLTLLMSSSLLVTGLSVSSTTQAASIATIQGRAVGSFCCVLDNQGNMDVGVWDPVSQSIINNTGSARFSITNNDDGVAPPDTTTKVTWGTASKASTSPSYLSDVNYFEFDGNGSDFGSQPGSTDAGILFRIGSFDYYNAATKQDKVTQVTFNLDMQVVDGMTMMFPTLQFDLAITNTPDNSDPEVSKDTASIVGAYMLINGTRTPISGPMQFMLDGTLFEFMLAGFAISGTNGLPQLDINGNYIFSDSTSAYENTLTSAGIYGLITEVSAVPVPAAVWLFGSGLLAFAAAVRRKKT